MEGHVEQVVGMQGICALGNRGPGGDRVWAGVAQGEAGVQPFERLVGSKGMWICDWACETQVHGEPRGPGVVGCRGTTGEAGERQLKGRADCWHTGTDMQTIRYGRSANGSTAGHGLDRHAGRAMFGRNALCWADFTPGGCCVRGCYSRACQPLDGSRSKCSPTHAQTT